MFVQSLGVTKGLQNIPVCTNIMLFTLTPNHTTVITVGRHTSRSPHWPCTNEQRTMTPSPSRRSKKPSLSLPQVRVFPSIFMSVFEINSYEHNIWLKALSLTIKFHSNSCTKIPFTTAIIAIKVRYLMLWDVCIRGEINLVSKVRDNSPEEVIFGEIMGSLGVQAGMRKVWGVGW